MSVSKKQLDEIIRDHERRLPLSAADAQQCTEAQYEQAYTMYEEGWTIPGVAEQVGIPADIAEEISTRQLHDKAVERHDPANCGLCRERVKNARGRLAESVDHGVQMDKSEDPLPDEIIDF